MAYVYRHIRLDKNEPFYIGIGSDKNYQRAFSNNKRNKFWKNIVFKTDYQIEILLDDLTWKEACEKEKEFIKLYGRKDLGTGTLTNLTDGGEGTINCIRSEEFKANVSNKMKNKKNALGTKKSEESKKRLSENMKGKKLSLGLKKSEESKKIISEKLKKIWEQKLYDKEYDNYLKQIGNL